MVEVLTVVTLIAMVAALAVPRYWQAHDRSAFTACGQNLTTLAKAVATYSNENGGFPDDIPALCPKYLAIIPTCPSAGSDTYSNGYTRSTNPQGFTLVCTGKNHPTCGTGATNEPWYAYGQGLGPTR